MVIQECGKDKNVCCTMKSFLLVYLTLNFSSCVVKYLKHLKCKFIYNDTFVCKSFTTYYPT